MSMQCLKLRKPYLFWNIRPLLLVDFFFAKCGTFILISSHTRCENAENSFFLFEDNRLAGGTDTHYVYFVHFFLYYEAVLILL